MIDLKSMPATGAAFVVALHGRLFVPLAGARRARGGSPEMLLYQFSAVNGISPHLLSLWAFDDLAVRPHLVAGLPNRSDRPTHWRLFRAAIEEIKGLDARGYACLLDGVDRIVRAYVLSRPDKFAPMP